MEQQTKPTCGPLFLRCLKQFLATASTPIEAFAAGYFVGQAEKVYLGACPAAMARPSPEHRTWMMYVAARLTEIYELRVSVFNRAEIADEIWLHRPEHTDLVAELLRIEFESPAWHTHRGMLCGIPPKEIDHKFHERSGYRQPCDRPNNS